MKQDAFSIYKITFCAIPYHFYVVLVWVPASFVIKSKTCFSPIYFKKPIAVMCIAFFQATRANKDDYSFCIE